VTRQQKTPQQRAEEQLGVAQRKVANLERIVSKHTKALRGAEADLKEARERLDYYAADPALKGTSTTSTQPGGTTA
jgi:hypothetical protein